MTHNRVKGIIRAVCFTLLGLAAYVLVSRSLAGEGVGASPCTGCPSARSCPAAAENPNDCPSGKQP